MRPALDGSQWTFHSQGPGSNPGHSNNALLKKDQKEIKTCNDVFLIVQYFYLHKSFQASFYIGTFNNTCTNVKKILMIGFKYSSSGVGSANMNAL